MTDSSEKPQVTSNSKVYDDGELWSFIRRCMSQGKDIHLDHAERTYEEYSARLDLAALERLPELQAYIVRAVVAARGSNETLKRRVCEWSEIEEGIGKFNTCKPGESFHLTQGMDLYPFCHWCGLEIEVTDDGYIHGPGTFPHSDGCLCSKCKPENGIPNAQKAEVGGWPLLGDCIACSVGNPGVYIKDGRMVCPHRPESGN